ncbi:PREDICTED: V-set and immunoglobulin domain-containing protein 8 [Haliaeetus leucocephalus]|uniref:V-set and immunoglobulin domain-containing protein 8 n=1 Tax=Haliaeetus leucocephalus TaxID=52644 RepID=UPI00053CC853|nr:PREDICTED: V-set and immunoglobulin domain-containing protein 8 [Haliaeetus leucocephalus]
MAGHGASLLLLLGLMPALLLAVRINSKGREVLYLAKGDSVKLGCPYVLEPEDNGPQGVGIEWIQITPERPGPENVFLSYHDHHVNYGSGSGLQDRVAFVQNDPSQYDASIRLADLQVSDTGTYQCRVKKNTVAVHEVIVTVQEKPATPQCWTEGEVIEGSSILLRCYSRGGTSPLAYQWAKLADGYGGGRLPSGTIQGRAPGDLLIRSLSEVHAGIYQCRVTNRVGYSVCQLNLSLVPRGRQAGIIVGSILGSLLLLSLLGLLIWALICRYRRKECQRACSDCRSSTGGTMTRTCNVCAHHSYSPHGISYMQCQHSDGDERAAALMCNEGIRHQYEDAFRPHRLQNWSVPRTGRQRPLLREGSTLIIADDRGHLLPTVPRSQASPWGTFVGTWDMPPRIPPARLDLTSRSATAAVQLMDRIRQPTALTHACNGLWTEITGKVSIKSPMRRDVPHKADVLPADDVSKDSS